MSTGRKDIEAAHPVGQAKDGNPVPLIVHFHHRADQNECIKERSNLKNTGVVIQEDLTKKKVLLLNRVRNHDLVEQTWFSNGRIHGKVNKSPVKVCFPRYSAHMSPHASPTASTETSPSDVSIPSPLFASTPGTIVLRPSEVL